MTHLKHIRKYFFRYKKPLIIGIFITIIARIFSLVMPQYVENTLNVIEQYIKSGNEDTSEITYKLITYTLIIIGSAILSGLFTFMMRQNIINMSRNIEFDLKNEIFKKYETLDTSFYKENPVGDLMNRISEDVSKVRMYAGPAIMYSVQTATLFLCVIPLMLYTSVTLTIYTLLPLPFLSIAIYLVSRKVHKKTLITQEYLSDLSTFSQETFSGIGVIKTYAIENRVNNDLEKLAESGRQKYLSLAKTQALFFPMMTLMIGLSVTFVIFIGGKLYIEGSIETIGVIAKFSIYVLMLTWPVATVGWVSSIIQQAEASQRRINEFLDTQPSIVNYNDSFTSVQGNIRFENVSLLYSDTQIKALKNVSFSVEKGKRTAIIGKTGSGKSTILDLIARLYDPTEGTIYIDETPIKKLNLNNLREEIAFVPQDSFLFSDTIKNNIKFGNENATDDQIVQSAKIAEVHQNIIEFTHQYDSVLGERGVSLSGGQKQRVSIARAILKPAHIYLFDDSLSAVDTDTEDKILHNLEKISKDVTTIIVSHRISSAKNVDKIIILDDGKIVGEGTHSSLYKTNLFYKKYYDMQSTEQSVN